MVWSRVDCLIGALRQCTAFTGMLVPRRGPVSGLLFGGGYHRIVYHVLYYMQILRCRRDVDHVSAAATVSIAGKPMGEYGMGARCL